MPRTLFMHRVALAALLFPAVVQAQAPNRSPAAGEPKVGPPRGTVIVVGGGSMGPEIYSQFIEAAGGPDALIIDVPNAGGADSYGQDAPGTRGWKAAGAKNVHVLFTKDRKIADSDSFVAVIKKAGGVWFEGGRQFHLVRGLRRYQDRAGVPRCARSRRCRRRIVGRRLDPRRLPRARCAVEQQPDHGLSGMREGIRVSARTSASISMWWRASDCPTSPIPS